MRLGASFRVRLEKGRRPLLSSQAVGLTVHFKALTRTAPRLLRKRASLRSQGTRPVKREQRKSEKESEREEESAFLHFLHFKATSTDVYGHQSLTGAQPTLPPKRTPPPPYFSTSCLGQNYLSYDTHWQ